jgi:predicted acetyltransferase
MRPTSVRPARPEDVDRLVGVHLAAFPDNRGSEARRRNFEHTPFGSFSDLRVLEHGGAIVGHAFLFRFEAFFGGRLVRTAGIASVGIAPEVRGRGLAAVLLTELESEARARGDAIAILYPFRQAFYRKLGYAPATPSLRVGASPRAIPDAWVAAARVAPLRAATGDDLPAMEAAYLGYAARTTGLLVRPAQLWERKLTNERRHAIVLEDANGGKNGGIRGYATFRHEQAEAHADITLEIDDVVALDDEARRTLFGAMGAQRDQVRSIAWLASRDDAFVLALEDANRDRGGTAEVEHPFGTLAAGPMVKILDVETALGQRGYPNDGSFSFRLGERGPAFAVNVTNGNVRVTRGDVLAKASLSPDVAGSLFFGGVRARELARLGSLAAPSNELANLDAIVSLPAFETLDAF